MAGPTLAATEALSKLAVEEIARGGKTVSSKLSSVLQGSKVLRPVDRIQTKTINLGIRASNFLVPKAFKFWHFARVELRPPRLSEWAEAQKGFNNLVAAARAGKWKQTTTKEALVNACVTSEILFWFFIGECIGKGHLIGYQYPGAVWFGSEL